MPVPRPFVKESEWYKNVTSEIRQKASKEFAFFPKSVMCSFRRLAFATLYFVFRRRSKISVFWLALYQLEVWKYSSKASINCQGLPLRKVSDSKMLQVKSVKRLQKSLLSFSKVLCALFGEWLSSL